MTAAAGAFAWEGGEPLPYARVVSGDGFPEWADDAALPRGRLVLSCRSLLHYIG